MKRLGGVYWRLEMLLGLVLGYGNAFGVESGPEPHPKVKDLHRANSAFHLSQTIVT